MKKIMKSKKGFTLVEMVIVIAIIVILASVVIFTVSRFINAANTARDDLQSHVDNVDEVMDEIDLYI